MQKDFAQWHKLKSDLQAKDAQKYFHGREIWFCSIGLNVGHEEDGKNALYDPIAWLSELAKQRGHLAVSIQELGAIARRYSTS